MSSRGSVTSTGKRSSGVGAQLLLASASLLIPFLALAGIEGALRVAGLGAPRMSTLAYQQLDLPILEPTTRPDGTPILHTTDPRLPFQTILRDKPENGLRVFTFGGSAAAGLGFSPNVTFTRHLERMLRAARPERSVEVLGLGIVALSSRQVAILVEHVCQTYAPDLVVIYSGNNEFLEIHARKYAEANASGLERMARPLFDTNLYRLLARSFGSRPTRDPSELRHEDLRLSEARIIEDLVMQPAEIEQIVDGYEANLERATRAARERDVELILLSVASNWRWLGRNDLPESWLSELLGDPGASTVARYEEAVRLLDEQLRTVPKGAASGLAHPLLFRRALAHEALGDLAAAREDYRAAMNADPHLRRTLDAANERAGRVAGRTGATYVDTVEALAATAPAGIVGFDEFYDYVHFTPRGAVLVAAEIARALSIDPTSYVRIELEKLAELKEDPFAVYDWMGFGFDAANLSSRDLWKYDLMLEDLDARLAIDPQNLRALVYRGNAAFFRHDGGASAARDYRAALASGRSLPDVQANLDALLRDRRP